MSVFQRTRSKGVSLSASATSFLNSTAQGAVVAALRDPFGGGSAFSTIGTAPPQLSLNGSTIVRGAGAVQTDTAYSIAIRAAKGGRAVEETLRLQARAPAGAPVNMVAPSIEGNTTDGSSLIFRMGTWSGAETFDIAVLATDGSTILDRRPVAGDTTGTVSALGKTIYLVVWGENGSGEASAASANFGPILAVGDVLILAGIFGGPGARVNNMDYIGLSSTMANDAYDGVNRQVPGFPGLYYGWAGSNVGTGVISTNMGSPNTTDPRFRGRTPNLSASQGRFEVDLPSPGVYLVYGASYIGSGSQPVALNFGVYDVTGPGGTTSVVAGGGHQNAAQSGGNNQDVRDAFGNITTNQGSKDLNIGTWSGTPNNSAGAPWASRSAAGGQPVEVTMTGTKMAIARHSGTSSTPNINNFAIFKKAT